MFSFWCNNRMYPLNHLTVFHVCMSWRMFVSFYFFALFCENYSSVLSNIFRIFVNEECFGIFACLMQNIYNN